VSETSSWDSPRFFISMMVPSFSVRPSGTAIAATRPPVISWIVSVILPPAQARVFRRDGAYIITGGLGGLGLFLAETMASPGSGTGCGRIVLH
jgi:hypothetical protein